MHFISNIWGFLFSMVFLALYLMSISTKEIVTFTSFHIRFEERPYLFSCFSGVFLMFGFIFIASSVTAIPGLDWLRYFERGSSHASMAWATAWFMSSTFTYIVGKIRG